MLEQWLWPIHFWVQCLVCNMRSTNIGSRASVFTCPFLLCVLCLEIKTQMFLFAHLLILHIGLLRRGFHVILSEPGCEGHEEHFLFQASLCDPISTSEHPGLRVPLTQGISSLPHQSSSPTNYTPNVAHEIAPGSLDTNSEPLLCGKGDPCRKSLPSGIKYTWIQVSVLPNPTCLTWTEWRKFLQFLHLWNRNYNSTNFTGLFWNWVWPCHVAGTCWVQEMANDDEMWWDSNCELSGQKTSRYQRSLAPRDSFVRPGRTTHAPALPHQPAWLLKNEEVEQRQNNPRTQICFSFQKKQQQKALPFLSLTCHE